MNIQYVYTTLLRDLPYFKKLDVKKRELLCARTIKFIKSTRFIGKQKLEVTDKMKVLIAACGQQLTLSFKKNYLYDHFDRIIVYPHKYYSTYTKNYHVGEMNTAGLIVFSWEDFYEGIQTDNDNKNVGLHEFAHALEFIDIANKDTDDRFSYALDKEFMVAQDYINNNPPEPFFRNYVTKNRAEFFAVATEYFFESPHQFYEKHPSIYALFCKIYGQDLREHQLTFNAYKTTPLVDLGKPIYDPIFTFKQSNIWNLLSLGLFIYMAWSIYTEGILFYKVFFLINSLMINFISSFYFTSFSVFEKGILIHQGVWRTLFSNIISPTVKNDTRKISYENVFSGNMNGKNDQNTIAYPLFFLLQKIDEIPSLTLSYYSNGKIKKTTISLLAYYTKEHEILSRLYLEKKVCIRIDGQIKRYDL